MKKTLVISMLLLMSMYLIAATDFAVTNIFAISEDTLPVELASFTAVFTVDRMVKVQWTTHSETNLMGYYIYRNQRDNLASAYQVSGLIEPANSSTAQHYSFVDSEIQQSGIHYYWLLSSELGGGSQFHGPALVNVQIETEQAPPSVLYTGLKGIYPNPFNPNGSIEYSIEEAGNVQFKIYNAKGQVVKNINRSHGQPGQYVMAYDALDNNGKELPSGIYLLNMQSGKSYSTRKMLLMK